MPSRKGRCNILDKDRIDVAEYKEKDSSKKRRKVLRGLKKKKEDKEQKVGEKHMLQEHFSFLKFNFPHINLI